MCDITRLIVEADMRILLASIKPGIKEICKNVKYHSYHELFEKYNNFS